MAIAVRNTQVPTARQWSADNARRADYRRSFAQMPRQEVLLDSFGDTVDIVNRIMDVVNHRPLEKQVANFSADFGGRNQYERLYQLWHFCRHEIKYKKDPRGKQFIKHPLAVYEDGFADCKSLMLLQVFTIKALRAQGYDLTPIVRFASYDGERLGHVYPIVIMPDGSEVIVDSVFDRFDAEQKPTHVEDYVPTWATAKKKQKTSINGLPCGKENPGWKSYLQL
jgi:hypothetical protein